MQENLRSAVYRSLTKTLPVTSQDCNEATHSRTTTRSKTSSSAEMEPVAGRGKEEEEAMVHKSNASLQLLQVSRGAKTLTQKIELWSKTPSDLDFRSEAFAQDLLRGALDLQESLQVLEKLRDASDVSARMHLRKKPESYMGQSYLKEEEIYIQDFGSKRYEVIKYHNRRQEPYLSAHFSSINGVEELKRITKENVYMQKLLLPSSDDKEASSSRSLRFTVSNRFNENLVRAEDQLNKAKGSNLVAKLMGLEQVPSENDQPPKEEERSRSNFGARFHIGMPKANKAQVEELNTGLNKKKRNEVAERMHMKGLLRRSQVEEQGFQPPISSVTKLKLQCRYSDKDSKAPPIVSMKPVHSFQRDGQIKKEAVSDKSYKKEAIRLVKLVHQENNFDKRTTLSNACQQKEAKHLQRTKVESSATNGIVASSRHRQQREKTIMVKMEQNRQQKPVKLDKKEEEESKVVKATQALMSRSKCSSTMARPDRRLHPAKIDASPQMFALQDQPNYSLELVQKVPTNSCNEKITLGEKAIRRSTTIKKTNDEMKCREGKTVKPRNGSCKTSVISRNSPGDQSFKKIEHHYKPYYKGNIRKEQVVSSEEMAKATNQGASTFSLEEGTTQISFGIRNIEENAEMEDNITYFLVNTQSFISSAENHFGLHLNKSLYSQSKITMEMGIDAKLFFDLAEELMACKSYQHKHRFNPFLQRYRSWGTIYLSFHKLVEEISNGIKKLASYCNVSDAAQDSLHIRLDNDLKYENVVINSIWDFGWVNCVCLEAADGVVNEVGEDILSWLMEETAMQLVQQ